MKNFIDKKVLENTNFNTNTISPLSYLIHKMSKPGNYNLLVNLKNSTVFKAEVIVSNEFASTSENIDLGLLATSGIASKYRVNADNGFILFYNSVGFTEYSIQILEANRVEFDSNKPSKGDLCAINLMKPGKYELKDEQSRNSLNINIAYPSIQDKGLANQINKSLSISSFKDKELHSLPNQGLVIELNDSIKSFSIKMLSENLPKPGFSIDEQIKSRTAELLKQKIQLRPNRELIKKNQWKSPK